MASELTAYVPRLVLEWSTKAPGEQHRAIDGTMVFADLSGFTAMSERLARLGRLGAEEVSQHISDVFSELLSGAVAGTGSLLKFGGDAILTFYWGPDHVGRGVAAAHEMRATLRRIAERRTSAGAVRLRMSLGVHAGTFDFFLAGSSHTELVVCGPSATRAVEMESAASAGQILLSPETCARLDPSVLGSALGPGRLLRRAPATAVLSPLELPPDVDATPFVPQALREHLAHGGHEPEHRQATIAFIHFVGVDEQLAAGRASEVAVQLQETIAGVQRRLDEHKVTFLGTDIYHDGGKVFATAGAPRATENDEERMLRALRAIADDKLPLRLRMGVNRGHGFAADVGPFFRRTYTVMGDVTNTAARVMARAADGEILATPSVLDRSRTVFEGAELEAFTAKGKSKPIVAVRVGAVRGFRDSAPIAEVPLVGREAELADLLEARDAAREGRGSAVEIAGEPGLGASRLALELIERSPGWTVLTGGGQAYESSTPYYVAASIVRGALGLDVRATAGDVLARVEALDAQLLPWLPLLGPVLGIELPMTHEVEQLDEQFRVRRLHALVGEVLDRLGPVIVSVDDVQWCDEASDALLRSLAASAEGRVLLVLVARAGSDGESIGHRLSLGPLERDSALALARALSSEGLLPQDAAAIAERSGGNPLLIAELVRAHTRGRDVESLPDNLESMATSRIDLLHPPYRSILRQASVLGREFPIVDLEQLVADAGLPSDGIETLGEFLEPSDGLMRFRHALFRDAAYQSISFRVRRALHLRVAELIENRAEPGQDAILSLHRYEGGDFAGAFRDARAGAIRALSQYASADALALFERALHAARHVPSVDPSTLAELWETCGRARVLLGDSAGALDANARARRLAGDPVSRARLYTWEGLIRSHQGKGTAALRWFRRGLNELDPTDADEVVDYEATLMKFLSVGLSSVPRLRLQLITAEAEVRFRQGQIAETIRLCDEVEPQARAINDDRSLGTALNIRHMARTQLGSLETRDAEEALEIYERLGKGVTRGNLHNNLGVTAYYAGHWDEARRHYALARDALEMAGNLINAAAVTNNLAEILSDQGHWSQAAQRFEEARAGAQASHFVPLWLVATSNLGRAAARSGDDGRARELYAEALRGYEEAQSAADVTETLTRIAELDVMQGRPEAALGSIEGLEVEPGALVGPLLERVRGIALIQLGRDDEGDAALARSLELAEGALYERALTLRTIADVMGARGDAPGPQSAEADEILHSLGVVATPSVPLPTS